MIKTTPFHPRLSELNTTGLWSHWAGYLSAQKYDMSAKHEYFGIRNSAGFFDSSPLYKYWIRGRDAEKFLAGVMTRDIRTCRPGRAQYTVWCDDAGYILEDGVLFRHSDTEFMLTCAEPNMGYLRDLIGRLDVQITDATGEFGLLAVQGPRARDILVQLAPEVRDVPFFGITQAKIGKAPVTISRTGYTGDLGYEILVGAGDAVPMLDAVIAAGTPYGMRAFGEQALLMARIEAGLVLINVEFSSSRFAYTDHDRVTPVELGFSWMLRGIDDDTRPFIGRKAIRAEIAGKTSRWSTVGLTIDWQEWNQRYTDAGLLPPKDETPLDYESMLYDDAGARIGYATSLMYSPSCSGTSRSRGCTPSTPVSARGCRSRLRSTTSTRRSRRTWPSSRCSTPSERRRDDGNQGHPQDHHQNSKRHGVQPFLRRHRRGRRTQRPGERRLPAKAGLKTLIIERRHLVGGAAITEELHPGFQFTTFSYALSLLRPDIIQELELVKYGFLPLLMPSSFAPMENGDYLLLGPDRDENIKEIMRHSSHDADAMDRYEHDVERVCQLVKPLFDRVPPNIFGKSPEDLADAAWLRAHLGNAPQKVLHDTVRMLTGSAADFLDDYFESDILKGYLASSGIIGTKVGPMSQGSGLVLLFHSLGEHDGHFGSWAFHKGGNGGFTQVLARAAQGFGAEILLDTEVDCVITKDGRAVGVALADGTELSAPTVVSALDPRRTFTQLVEPRELPSDLVENINRMRFRARRPRSTSPWTAPRATRPSATAPTSTAASPTSARR